MQTYFFNDFFFLTFQIQFSISGNASPELRTWNVPEHGTDKLKIVSEKIFVIKPFRIFPDNFCSKQFGAFQGVFCQYSAGAQCKKG